MTKYVLVWDNLTLLTLAAESPRGVFAPDIPSVLMFNCAGAYLEGHKKAPLPLFDGKTPVRFYADPIDLTVADWTMGDPVCNVHQNHNPGACPPPNMAPLSDG